MNDTEIIKIFKENGALLTGHFLLSSGLHSDKYVQCALVLQYPDIAEKLARALVDKINATAHGFRPGLVISPALGGVIIGQEVARVLGCRAIFTERANGVMALRRGFKISKGEKALVIEDVITTGKSTMEVASAVHNQGGTVTMAAALIDRTVKKGQVLFSFPYKGLVELEIKNYSPGDCPLCKKGLPLVKPGSRK